MIFVNRIYAIVGMAGSGKSIACDVLKDMGWKYIRFGQVTIDRLEAEGKAVTEESEKKMREALRKEYGMGAYALLALPAIEKGFKKGSVVIDGLYSWSEYKILKEIFKDTLTVVHIYASPKTRYLRLDQRSHDIKDEKHRMRRLAPVEAEKRDYAEIENIEKGGPIAMADYTVVNEGALDDLKQAMKELAVR
jgi:dephospho-CoA kinase